MEFALFLVTAPSLVAKPQSKTPSNLADTSSSTLSIDTLLERDEKQALARTTILSAKAKMSGPTKQNLPDDIASALRRSQFPQNSALDANVDCSYPSIGECLHDSESQDSDIESLDSADSRTSEFKVVKLFDSRSKSGSPANSESSQRPVANLSLAASMDYAKVFPIGYKIIPTPPDELLCGFNAVIRSMQAIRWYLPCPSVKDLGDVFHSEAFVEHATAFGMTNENNCKSLFLLEILLPFVVDSFKR